MSLRGLYRRYSTETSADIIMAVCSKVVTSATARSNAMIEYGMFIDLFCAHSPPFSVALSKANLRYEGQSGKVDVDSDTFKEAREGIIDLSAEDEEALDMLIKYLYGHYRSELALVENSEPTTIAALYEMASRFGIDDCAQVAGISFHDSVSTIPDQDSGWLAGQSEMVKFVYMTPEDDTTLRKVLIDCCVGFSESKLEAEQEFLQKAISENAEFAIDLLKAHAAARGKGDKSSAQPQTHSYIWQTMQTHSNMGQTSYYFAG